MDIVQSGAESVSNHLRGFKRAGVATGGDHEIALSAHRIGHASCDGMVLDAAHGRPRDPELFQQVHCVMGGAPMCFVKS